MEEIKNLFYSVKLNRCYNESDNQPYEKWQKGIANTGICLHPEGFYIFISQEQAIKCEEYLEGPGDPYWETTNPGFKDAQQCMNECTLELIQLSGINNKPTTRILDVACGKGEITNNIKKRYCSSSITGLDISLTAIREAVRKHLDIQFIVADCYELPFAPETFDLIVCNNFWEHITDPFLLANNLNRVLKSGGSLIISTPSRYNFDNLWSVLAGRKVNFQNPTFHVTEYSIGQIKEQLKRCGFSVEKIISKPVPLYGASWKTKLKYRFIKPAIQKFLNFIKSHHVLETSAFFLARKNN